MIKRYSSMFNCNQNYHKYKQNIKYGFKDLISKQIISQFQWGLKNFSENSSKILNYILLNLFT